VHLLVPMIESTTREAKMRGLREPGVSIFSAVHFD
jgi:hypothetical protein